MEKNVIDVVHKAQQLQQGMVRSDKEDCSNREKSARSREIMRVEDMLCVESSSVTCNADKQKDIALPNLSLERGNKRFREPSVGVRTNDNVDLGALTDGKSINKNAALPKLFKKSIPTEHSGKQTLSCPSQRGIENASNTCIDDSLDDDEITLINVQAAKPFDETTRNVENETSATYAPRIYKPLSNDRINGDPLDVSSVTEMLKAQNNIHARQTPVEVTNNTSHNQKGSLNIDPNVRIDLTSNRRVNSEILCPGDELLTRAKYPESQENIKSLTRETVGIAQRGSSTTIQANNLNFVHESNRIRDPVIDEMIVLPVIPADLTADIEKALNDLEAKTGCHIVINKDASQKSVTLSSKGTVAALKEMKRAVEVMFPSRAKRGGESSEFVFEKQLLVPDIVIKSINSMLEELKDESGANINILPSTERSKQVTLTGRKRNVQKLEHMIKFLISNPEMDLLSAVETIIEEKGKDTTGGNEQSGCPISHAYGDSVRDSLSQSSQKPQPHSRGFKHTDEENLIDLIQAGYDTCAQGSDYKRQHPQSKLQLNEEENRSQNLSERMKVRNKSRVEEEMAQNNIPCTTVSNLDKTNKKKGVEKQLTINDKWERKKRHTSTVDTAIVSSTSAPAVRQTVLSSGTLVQSTSSKAGLSVIRVSFLIVELLHLYCVEQLLKSVMQRAPNLNVFGQIHLCFVKGS